MSKNKKRPFSEWAGGDYYLCADCDSVYHGQQELCEHLAKHADIKRQVKYNNNIIISLHTFNNKIK